MQFAGAVTETAATATATASSVATSSAGSRRAVLTEAIPAQNRAVTARLERYCRLDTALGARNIERLSRRTLVSHCLYLQVEKLKPLLISSENLYL